MTWIAETAAVLIVAIICFELLLFGFVRFLRQQCPWLITGQDLQPNIDEDGLTSFMAHGWDAELGWVRRANSQRTETGRGGVKTSFTINAQGARHNPGFDGKDPDILVYGDSYAFARQVNDDETWGHFLSKALGRNAANFGVGNYGLDQALLRLEKEQKDASADIFIMAVVPETLCRIHSAWKHFSEYGNTFAFKPRFKLNAGTLQKIPNRIDTREKFFELPTFLDALKRDDYFFENKFQRDIFLFPYSISLCRNFPRHWRLMRGAITDRLGLTKKAAFVEVMKRNIQITADMYTDPAAVALFSAQCARFARFCESKNATPVLVMMPQLLDVALIREGRHYYASALKSLPEGLVVVDVAPELLRHENVSELYIDDQFGGHLSAKGNQVVADLLTPICKNIFSNVPDWRSGGNH